MRPEQLVASRLTSTSRVLGAIACAVILSVAFAPMLAAQSRSKVITPAAPKRPAKFDFPKRYDGDLKQTKTAEGQADFFSAENSSSETLEAKLTWVEGLPEVGELSALPPAPLTDRTGETRNYKVVAGEITVTLSSHKGGGILTCDIKGSHTFSIEAVDVSGMMLQVGSNGKYRLLLIASLPKWEATEECSAMGRTTRVPFAVSSSVIALGAQTGQITYGIHGEPKTPIDKAPYKITGKWNFAAVTDR